MKSAKYWTELFCDRMHKYPPLTIHELVEMVQADVKATIYKELYLENERKSHLVIGNETYEVDEMSLEDMDGADRGY